MARLRVLVSLFVVCLLIASCESSIPPINRVQPQVIEKSAFDGEWYYQQTVIDVPHTIEWTIVGESSRMERIDWEIQEELLIARRAYQWIRDGEGPGVSGAGEVGAPIAIYRIEGHFDIRRDYNTVTGEEINTLLENDVDRPWYQRRFMRVDWSENLVTDPEFLIFSRFDYGIESESVAYYQEDPNHPDHPHFDFDDVGALNYFDITNKLFVQPTTIDYGDGWGPEPACWLLYQTHTDCAAAEVAVRHSFMRAEPDRGYQPWDYPGDRMERFGYFVSDRPGYDDEYGVVEPSRSFFINRHSLWVESYARDAEGGLVQCTTDADCGGGGICDDQIVRGGVSDTPACTLPYRERLVKPIAYHLSEAFPEELKQDADWVGQQWNATFVETIASLRENECLAEGGDPGSCAAERTREDGQTAFVICDNPVAEDDHPACGAPGAVARIGDVRYSILGWEPEPSFGMPLGFGPANIDPETGEIVTGTAWVYGAGVEQLATYGRDIIALINGDLPPTELIEGENVERWVAAMAGRERSSMRTADRHVIRMDGDDARAVNDAMGIDRLTPARRGTPPRARSRGEMAAGLIAARQAVLRGDVLHHDDGRAQARLHNLRDSHLEALMTGPQMLFAAGIDPTAPLNDTILDRASPLRQMSPARMRSRLRERRRIQAERCVMRAEDFSDQGLIGLAQTIRDAVESGDGTIQWYGQSYDLRADGGGIDYEAVREMLRHPIFASTAAHEIGHTLGLRHNFSGSYDSLNYAPRYWELRDDGVVRPRAYDPLTSAEIRGRIREYQYSTVMDYGNNFLSTDAQGLGHYDHAAIKMGYGDLVEVFDEASDPAELAWVHFMQLYGYPVALDSQSYLVGGTVRAHTYTEIPGLAGGIDALESRRDVPWSTLEPDPDLASEGIDIPLVDPSGRPAVPYRFCSDEFADLIPDCSVYDAGADQYEVIQSILDTYWNYYIFNNFRRERLGFDAWDVYLRIYYNYFSKLLYQNQDYVFNRVFLDEQFEGDPTYADFYDREDGMGAYTVGVGAAFNMLSQVIATPEPGPYVEYDIGDGTTAYFEEYYADPDVEIEVGDGRYLETTWNFDEGYYWFDQLERSGFYYDKTLAIETITDPQAYFVGRDEASDLRGFAISFHTTFPDATNGLIGSLLADDWRGYAARPGSGGLVYPTVDQLYGGNAPGVPIDPNTGYSVQLFAAIWGMAFIPLSYDRTFLEQARIWVEGGAEGIAIPTTETVTFTDPFTSVTFVAASYLDGTRETGVGARMLQHAAALEAMGDYDNLDLFMDNIQLMRSLNWEYGFGYY